MCSVYLRKRNDKGDKKIAKNRFSEVCSHCRQAWPVLTAEIGVEVLSCPYNCNTFTPSCTESVAVANYGPFLTSMNLCEYF